MKVAIGQINPTIGDFAGNLQLCVAALGEAERGGADLLVLPELAVCGYPPRDLLERAAFVDESRRALEALAARVTGRTAVVVGFPERLGGGGAGRRLANAAAVLAAGRIASVHRKSLLPTYDVFDEWRYFAPADALSLAVVSGRRVGVTICEDVWNDADFWPERLYREDPIEKLVQLGAEVIVNLSASPYTIEKRHLRRRMLAATAKRWARPVVVANQVGGHDDLVFDGSSGAWDAAGREIARAAEHESDHLLVDLECGQGPLRPFETSDARSALGALVLGTRDYARRCGFSTAILGLSGGIDSALVAAIAVRALGAASVRGVAMPSRHSSAGALRDARALARNLGITLEEISIEPQFAAALETLRPAFGGKAVDTTEENLQARIRGMILMALSNKHGHLLLTTGNKSELATGYCTLYGDMCGGLAVVSDVPKTMVYSLAREVNAAGEVIPQASLDKPPSAELRPGQTDQDSLPPYAVLDPILEAHLEGGMDSAALCAAGFEPDVVEQVVRLVRTSEYKRRQMPPGIKITGKAFGPGRSMPIAQTFRG